MNGTEKNKTFNIFIILLVKGMLIYSIITMVVGTFGIAFQMLPEVLSGENNDLSASTTTKGFNIKTDSDGSKTVSYVFEYDGITYTCNTDEVITDVSKVNEEAIIYFNPVKPDTECGIDKNIGINLSELVVTLVVILTLLIGIIFMIVMFILLCKHPFYFSNIEHDKNDD